MPPKKESKSGQNNPENRRSLGLWTVSKTQILLKKSRRTPLPRFESGTKTPLGASELELAEDQSEDSPSLIILHKSELRDSQIDDSW